MSALQVAIMNISKLLSHNWAGKQPALVWFAKNVWLAVFALTIVLLALLGAILKGRVHNDKSHAFHCF